MRKEKVAYLAVGMAGNSFHLFSSTSISTRESNGLVSVPIPPTATTLPSVIYTTSSHIGTIEDS